MNEVAWQTEHSVDAVANLDFAWAYMTDVTHWDDPPAQFRLNGAFAAGTQGTTEMPGQPLRSWLLRAVQPPEYYTIELYLDRAMLTFTWRFAGLPGGRTRLTQRIALEGENASAYRAEVQEAFTATLAAGMNRVVLALDRAYATSRASDAEER